MPVSKHAVSFLLSPTTAITWYPPASRVLTSALLGNSRLQVTLSDAPVNVFLDSFRQHRRALHGRTETDALESYARLPFRVAPHLDVATGRYDDRVLASLPTELVLLSSLSIFDLFVVKRLLDAGKRVLLGGNLTSLYSPSQLRALLVELGADRARVERDLVAVRGYVTPETDLAALIDRWRDAEVAPVDHRGLFTCREDLLTPFLSAIATVTRRVKLAIPLSSGCWYGECEFCTARNQPALDFAAGLGAEEVVAHLKELSALYGTEEIVLTDNYLGFTPREQDILLRRRPLRVTVYSGVRLLCNPEIAMRANRCADGLRIGIESGSDFALAQMKKGFGFDAVERAIQNLIDHCDRDKELTLLIVYDLPHESADDVRRGFGRLVELKSRLLAAGFRRVQVSGFPLFSFPGTPVLASPFLEARSLSAVSDEELCGAWVLQRWYERARGVRLPAELASLITPYRRRGRDGASLPSDFNLLDRATVDFLEGFEDGEDRAARCSARWKMM
jgi:radical SAM superfamily enzyme YgiQ (UPF0313 family)